MTTKKTETTPKPKEAKTTKTAAKEAAKTAAKAPAKTSAKKSAEAPAKAPAKKPAKKQPAEKAVKEPIPAAEGAEKIKAQAEEAAMEIKQDTVEQVMDTAVEAAEEIVPEIHIEPQRPPLKVLFVASECAPFVKTGGLADVVGALPAVLKQKGVDVRVMLPLYSAIGQQYRSQMTYITNFYVPMGWRSQYCGIMTMEKDGVIYYFLDNEYYFGRSYIYGESNNEEGERFAFFSKAALDSLRHINFYPDVLHAHDWQAAMSIALLRMQYSSIWEYRDIATMYTIHNLRYQGIFGWEHMNDILNIDKASFNLDTIEYFKDVNFTKGALSFADAITTVSPTYAKEIQTAQYGENLDGLLRKRSWDVHGILNGIDEDLFNPETDTNLPFNFSAADLSGKAKCKEALRTEFWLDKDDSPLVGIVTRFTGQKGLDIIEYAIEALMEKGIQLAVLGSGDTRYEHLFSWASWRYGGRIAARLTYSNSIANRIYAGSDMFLMPSQFEPCGLAQMIALRYGTLPIVRETGGLKDSITPYNKFTGEGLGFTFTNYNHIDMLGAVDRAIEAYRNHDAWQRLIQNAMGAHFTWDISADEYINLYNRIKYRKY